MAIDDSCRKPGTVPFKWEIRPGVPKIQQQHKQTPKPSPPPSPLPPRHSTFSSPAPLQKLKPPPAGFQFYAPFEHRNQSFRSTSRVYSERWRLHQPTRGRPDCVSPGCFPARSTSRRKESKKKGEQGYFSDLETLPRWSVSSRRSFSPFTASPASSSLLSCKSSPQHVVDSDWAGFGLF
ncbi:uncharacterized protein LOC123203626 [Mangifera indica]|uniref:uncharacterized protein LOC123203626 n=1 Tax=Mangifera indica TaxID=29780 RepID=UPI001CF967D0|nr:uncharacterized protein LOC123203626 [Mangifera indica]